MPVVPGYTDREADMETAARLLSSLDGDRIRVQLLPYHRLAQSKYERLEAAYSLKDVQAPPKERLERLRDILKGTKLDASVGG